MEDEKMEMSMATVTTVDTREHSKRYKRRHRRVEPQLQCWVCKRVVKAVNVNGGLSMIRHDPDNGEAVDQDHPGCWGLMFPDRALPML